MLCHPYCKPFLPTLKEFFCLFYKFFYEPPQQPERPANNAPQEGCRVGAFVQKPAHPPAQGKKIEPAPQAECGEVEHPDPPVAPAEGKGEQGQGDAQPEQGVQQVPQPAQAQPAAQEAEQVVHDPGARPQPRRLQKQDPLLIELQPVHRRVNRTAARRSPPSPRRRPHRSGNPRSPPPSARRRPG